MNVYSRIADRAVWPIFRFLFGNDTRVIWLLTFLNSIYVLFLFSLLLAFGASFMEVLLYAFFVPPGIWGLLILVAALKSRPFWMLGRTPEPDQYDAIRSDGLAFILILVRAIYGADNRLAIWLILIGGAWVAYSVIEVAPDFLKWGVPPGTGSFTPLEPVETLQDALVPLFFYIVSHSVGFWLMIAGILGVLLQYLRRLLVRSDRVG